MIVARTSAGLEVARQLGRKGGRKPQMTERKIELAEKLLASGIPHKVVARNIGVSVPTLYRWVPASAQASGRFFPFSHTTPEGSDSYAMCVFLIRTSPNNSCVWMVSALTLRIYYADKENF